MLCKNCGKFISDDMVFCVNCGSKVESSTLPNEHGKIEICNQSKEPNTIKLLNNKKIIFILVIALTLLAVFVTIFVLSNKQKGIEETTNPTTTSKIQLDENNTTSNATQYYMSKMTVESFQNGTLATKDITIFCPDQQYNQTYKYEANQQVMSTTYQYDDSNKVKTIIVIDANNSYTFNFEYENHSDIIIGRASTIIDGDTITCEMCYGDRATPDKRIYCNGNLYSAQYVDENGCSVQETYSDFMGNDTSQKIVTKVNEYGVQRIEIYSRENGKFVLSSYTDYLYDNGLLKKETMVSVYNNKTTYRVCEYHNNRKISEKYYDEYGKIISHYELHEETDDVIVLKYYYNDELCGYTKLIYNGDKLMEEISYKEDFSTLKSHIVYNELGEIVTSTVYENGIIFNKTTYEYKAK